ncbi:hypothetical protein H7U08_32160 [Bacillus cereus]|uniref:Pesticidal crystal protein domain-containing protein n=1 Tax=Bacillus cereus TaxID=1396 RepID=A0AAW4R261_BACCE|nr:hypothetical protein [Bacillus cereus]
MWYATVRFLVPLSQQDRLYLHPQLTREVYTDPVSLSISNPDIDPSFSQMENTVLLQSF